MCSTRQERIAALGQAIEDFASRTRSGAIAAARPSDGAPTDRSADEDATAASSAADGAVLSDRAHADADDARDHPRGTSRPEEPVDALSRLAELWAELATLDPEVAKRLPIYEA